MKFPISKPQVLLVTAAMLCAATGTIAAADKPVGITPTMMDATISHGADAVKIMRDQNNAAVVIPAFAKTSRPCPPFCIQPIKLAPGVETLGEREIIDYLVRMSKGDSSILVIDSRTPDWVKKGTIPGAVNIPWKSNMNSSNLFLGKDALLKMYREKGVTGDKMIVFYCNEGLHAAFNWFVAEKILGFSDVKIYEGSMGEWADDPLLPMVSGLGF